MKVYSEVSLIDFNFWGGAKDTVEELYEEDFNIIQSAIEEMECDENGMITGLFIQIDQSLFGKEGLLIVRLSARQKRRD